MFGFKFAQRHFMRSNNYCRRMNRLGDKGRWYLDTVKKGCRVRFCTNFGIMRYGK